MTIKDVAKKLGISHSTVSRALSDAPKAPVHPAMRKRVRETAAEMGYQPNLLARAVVTGKSGTLGLVAYRISAFSEQVQGFIEETHQKGFSLLVGLAVERGSQDVLDDPQLQIRQMLSRGVEGLLVHTQGYMNDADRILEAVDGRVPVVTFSYPMVGVSTVALDREYAFHSATKHLIQLGRRDIAFVGSSWEENDQTSAKGRGYYRAMCDSGFAPKRLSGGGTTLENGYDYGFELGRNGRLPEALVCRTDTTAMGICRGLQEVGVRVPDDVAIVGGGNQEIGAYFTPALTTTTTPTKALCEAAVELLLEQMGRNVGVRQIVIQPELIVRKSCGS